jgi:hypothetical protein
MQIPKGQHPQVNDYHLIKCPVGESGNVSFLTQNLQGKSEYRCTIPAGNAIMIPISTGECTSDEAKSSIAEDMMKCATEGNKYLTFIYILYLFIILTSKLSSGKTEEINTSNTSYSAGTPTIDPNLQRKIEDIRNAAATIKTVSVRIRDTIRTLRQSGAIDEVVSAVHESSIAMRDTTREISKVSSEIKKRGVLKETAKTIDETISAAKDTTESLKNSLMEVKEEAPQTVEVIKKARVRTKGRKASK